jgi:uncharacterized protein YeaO (DUF488 family)
LHAPRLAPSKGLLADWKAGKINEGDFEDRYFAELDMVREYIAKCLTVMNSRNAILLCYEKASDFCHRHLFRKYVKKEFPEINLTIEEL